MQKAEKTGRLAGISRIEVKGGRPVALAEVAISRASGVEGDIHGSSQKRQVTVLFRDGWEAACHDLGVVLPWTIRRANLFVDGLSAPPPGSMISVGDAVLQVQGETTPCFKMDDRYAGLQNALKPDMRGGVCCSVVQAGLVRVGDAVKKLPSAPAPVSQENPDELRS